MMQAFKLSTAADNASCDGAIFVLASGDVQVATDTAGSGHRWRLIDDHPWRHCYVMLPREACRGGRPPRPAAPPLAVGRYRATRRPHRLTCSRLHKIDKENLRKRYGRRNPSA